MYRPISFWFKVWGKMSFRLKMRSEPTEGRNLAAKKLHFENSATAVYPNFTLVWLESSFARGRWRGWKRPNPPPPQPGEKTMDQIVSLLCVPHRASICLPSDTFTCTELGLGQSPCSVPGLMKVAAAVAIWINKCYYTSSASDERVSVGT